jgi:hypothetical protein
MVTSWQTTLVFYFANRREKLIKFLFLLPLILCILWFAYLNIRGYSLGQGRKGFGYILVFSSVVAVFYMVMMWLTRF